MQAEVQWCQQMVAKLKGPLAASNSHLDIIAGKRLAYTNEALYYDEQDRAEPNRRSYQTDMLVIETKGGQWKPRVVIETKLGKVSTHDAITYSHKAATHKQVHPYLRYGFLLGGEGSHLPRRLFWHGAFFDFMVSWAAQDPSEAEFSAFLKLLRQEVKASRQLEEIMRGGSNPLRRPYTILHKRLILSGPKGQSKIASAADDELDEE